MGSTAGPLQLRCCANRPQLDLSPLDLQSRAHNCNLHPTSFFFFFFFFFHRRPSSGMPRGAPRQEVAGCRRRESRLGRRVDLAWVHFVRHRAGKVHLIIACKTDGVLVVEFTLIDLRRIPTTLTPTHDGDRGLRCVWSEREDRNAQVCPRHVQLSGRVTHVRPHCHGTGGVGRQTVVLCLIPAAKHRYIPAILASPYTGPMGVQMTPACH